MSKYGSISPSGSHHEASASSGAASDPLLPPHPKPKHRPSALQKRVSRSQRAFSRRQLLLAAEEEEQQPHSKPVLATLFGDQQKLNKKKEIMVKEQQKQQQKQGQGRKSTAGDMETGQQTVVPPRTSTTTSDPKKKHPHHTKHSWLYVLLHSHSRHPHALLYQTFISNLIVADVLFFVASTDQRWKTAHPELFYYEEGLVSTVFLVEYLCRIYVAPEAHEYHHNTSNIWRARWDYMTTPAAIVDAMAAVPFFLELPTGLSLPNLTWLRFFRLLRILKTKSYVQSMETVWRVIYYNREILTVALNMCCLLVLTTSVLMYYLRPRHNDNDNNDNGDDFSSLLSTMYLSAMMLTGQGQPQGELPWYTKGVVLLTGIFSVAMFAIPASMLTWGFEAEAERRAKRARQKYVASLQDENNNNDECDSSESEFSYGHYISSSSSGGDTTDEEYLAIIAGGAEEEGGDENGDGGDGSSGGTQQDEVVKQLIRTFQTSDVDASGALSMDEFIELMTDPSNVSQHMTMVGMATSLGFLAKRVQTLEHQLTESHNKLDDILKAVQK